MALEMALWTKMRNLIVVSHAESLFNVDDLGEPVAMAGEGPLATVLFSKGKVQRLDGWTACLPRVSGVWRFVLVLREVNEVVCGASSGEMVSISCESGEGRFVGLFSDGVSCVDWSGEAGLVLVASGRRLVTLTSRFEVIGERMLSCEGILGVCWRKDGQYAAVSLLEEDGETERVVVVGQDLGEHGELREEDGRGAGDVDGRSMAWRPSGALLAVSGGEGLRLFERNGLARGGVAIGGRVKSVAWTPGREGEGGGADMVAVEVEGVGVQVWWRRNYVWRKKIEWKLDDVVQISWGKTDVMMLQILRKHSVLQLGLWAEPHIVEERGTLASVVDGSKIQVTPLSVAVVPPPYSYAAWTLENQNAAIVSFAWVLESTQKDSDFLGVVDGKFDGVLGADGAVALDSDGSLHLVADAGLLPPAEARPPEGDGRRSKQGFVRVSDWTCEGLPRQVVVFSSRVLGDSGRKSPENTDDSGFLGDSGRKSPENIHDSGRKSPKISSSKREWETFVGVLSSEGAALSTIVTLRLDSRGRVTPICARRGMAGVVRLVALPDSLGVLLSDGCVCALGEDLSTAADVATNQFPSDKMVWARRLARPLPTDPASRAQDVDKVASSSLWIGGASDGGVYVGEAFLAPSTGFASWSRAHGMLGIALPGPQAALILVSLRSLALLDAVAKGEKQSGTTKKQYFLEEEEEEEEATKIQHVLREEVESETTKKQAPTPPNKLEQEARIAVASDALLRRSLERGSRLLALTSNVADPTAVMELPRGNLEQVRPRGLSVAAARSLLDGQQWAGALETCRRQRIDLNLLPDHNPVAFQRGVPLLLRQLLSNGPDHAADRLSLLLAQLRPEDVCRGGAYPHPPDHRITEAVPSEWPAQKRNSICQAVAQAIADAAPILAQVERGQKLLLSAEDSEAETTKKQVLSGEGSNSSEQRKLLGLAPALVAAWAGMQPPELGRALALAVGLGDSGPGRACVRTLLRAASGEQLFRTALLRCDPALASRVAREAGWDPRARRPFLRQLVRLRSIVDDASTPTAGRVHAVRLLRLLAAREAGHLVEECRALAALCETNTLREETTTKKDDDILREEDTRTKKDVGALERRIEAAVGFAATDFGQELRGRLGDVRGLSESECASTLSAVWSALRGVGQSAFAAEVRSMRGRVLESWALKLRASVLGRADVTNAERRGKELRSRSGRLKEGMGRGDYEDGEKGGEENKTMTTTKKKKEDEAMKVSHVVVAREAVRCDGEREDEIAFSCPEAVERWTLAVALEGVRADRVVTETLLSSRTWSRVARAAGDTSELLSGFASVALGIGAGRAAEVVAVTEGREPAVLLACGVDPLVLGLDRAGPSVRLLGDGDSSSEDEEEEAGRGAAAAEAVSAAVREGRVADEFRGAVWLYGAKWDTAMRLAEAAGDGGVLKGAVVQAAELHVAETIAEVESRVENAKDKLRTLDRIRRVRAETDDLVELWGLTSAPALVADPDDPDNDGASDAASSMWSDAGSVAGSVASEISSLLSDGQNRSASNIDPHGDLASHVSDESDTSQIMSTKGRNVGTFSSKPHTSTSRDIFHRRSDAAEDARRQRKETATEKRKRRRPHRTLPNGPEAEQAAELAVALALPQPDLLHIANSLQTLPFLPASSKTRLQSTLSSLLETVSKDPFLLPPKRTPPPPKSPEPDLLQTALQGIQTILSPTATSTLSLPIHIQSLPKIPPTDPSLLLTDPAPPPTRPSLAGEHDTLLQSLLPLPEDQI